MCIDGASVEEAAVQTLYGCWHELYVAVYHVYDMTDDSWEPAGKFEACNVAKPFAKVVNSWFLIHYCLTDDHDRQWHSIEDYTSAASAAENRFHGPFYVRFIEYNGSRPADSEIRRFLARDRTNLHCPCFNLGATFDSPSLRAAAILHEAWHHWQYAKGYDFMHQSCPHECDWYYFHPVSRYEFGFLHAYDTSPSNFAFHSPYQIMVEFLADLAECSTAEVPAVTRQMARASGNAVLMQKFRNNVFYRVGDPRP
jgi:hypothetical protein